MKFVLLFCTLCGIFVDLQVIIKENRFFFILGQPVSLLLNREKYYQRQWIKYDRWHQIAKPARMQPHLTWIRYLVVNIHRRTLANVYTLACKKRLELYVFFSVFWLSLAILFLSWYRVSSIVNCNGEMPSKQNFFLLTIKNLLFIGKMLSFVGEILIFVGEIVIFVGNFACE